jgi:hypothetical protein
MSPSIGGGVCKLGLRCAPEGPGGRAVGCVECVENLRVCSVHVSSVVSRGVVGGASCVERQTTLSDERVQTVVMKPSFNY